VNLADAFVGMATRWPCRKAVMSQHLNLTYAGLAERAAQSAQELRARGIAPETNVGICLRDNAETLVMIVALWMLQATAVPMDFRTRAAEKRLLAEEFNLAAILEDRQADADDYSSILVDPSWPEIIAKNERSLPWPRQREAEVAFISLTSGTTGRPKGIVINHKQMLLRSICDAERLDGPLLNPLPLSFSASRTYTFSSLFQGSGVYFFPLLFSAQQLADAILDGMANGLCAVPTIVRNLLEVFGEPSTPAFTGLRALYCLGAPMLPEEKVRAKRFLSNNFIQEYGSSICGRISALSGSDLDARPDTVGRVLPHVTLQVVDINENVVRPGDAGVIRLRSPGMAQSIYRGGQGPSDGFKGGWAYPGDIGAFDDDGFLHLLGRTSDVIIRGGANVHPSEVERVISQYEGVVEVAVVGFTKFPEGEEIAAFVVSKRPLTESALEAHCRARLVPDKRPRKFILVSDLPRNANGKILRTELRKRLENAC